MVPRGALAPHRHRDFQRHGRSNRRCCTRPPLPRTLSYRAGLAVLLNGSAVVAAPERRSSCFARSGAHSKPSLDLAVLYLRLGRRAEVRRLAEEILPLFKAQDVHREALAALTLFQEAARQDSLRWCQALILGRHRA